MDNSLKKTLKIPGTIVNAQNAQLLVSSGIPALDTILGGGLPVGTLALIEEGLHGSYSKVMLKYFLAEGVVNKHSIFIGSLDVNPFNIIKELPAVIDNSDASEPSTVSKSSSDNSNEKLKIAFRYQNLPTNKDQENEFSSNQIVHHFDLTKNMKWNDIENSDICYWNCQRIENNGANVFLNPAYNELLKAIKNKIQDGKFFLKDNPSKRSILRIGIHSLGSPMWLPERKHFCLMDASRDLDMFLFCLRALVRSAYAVVVVTVPSHLYYEYSLERCIHSSDIAMRLQAFSGTELENNFSLSDYHGFFHLTKLAPINSFTSKHPGSIEFVFKLRRKKFVIEKLHLPPDVQDSNDKKPITSGCSGGGSGANSVLDF